jgi:hypothetical protein
MAGSGRARRASRKAGTKAQPPNRSARSTRNGNSVAGTGPSVPGASQPRPATATMIASHAAAAEQRTNFALADNGDSPTRMPTTVALSAPT